MSKKYIVAGAGFRGFCDALALINGGAKEVHIVEPAPFFGGLMYSREFDGFYVDKGVHMFDSIPKDLAAIVNEIMEDQTRPIDFVSESALNGKVTQGYSLPDLSSLDDEGIKIRIKNELLELAKQERPKDDAKHLADWFERSYGNTAGGIFCDMFEGLYGADPGSIEATAINQTSMGRMKFLDDDEMMKLKQDPWLETVLAARRKVVGQVDDYVSIYPDSGEGMQGWCNRAKAWLENKGVKISLGEKIKSIEDCPAGVRVTTDKQTLEADQLIWANDNVSALGAILGVENNATQLQHATAMVFITLVTQSEAIKNFTYIQNFEPTAYTYRTSSAGIYSSQIKKDGSSFITCECPTIVGSKTWEKGDEIVGEVWDEVRNLEVIDQSGSLLNSEVLKMPVTFKLPKVGFNAAVEEMRGDIRKKCSNLVLRNVVPFYRREIYLDSLNIYDHLS